MNARETPAAAAGTLQLICAVFCGVCVDAVDCEAMEVVFCRPCNPASPLSPLLLFSLSPLHQISMFLDSISQCIKSRTPTKTLHTNMHHICDP